MNEVTTVAASRDEIIAACEQDLNFFAAFCLGETYQFKFPPLFVALWQIITKAAKEGRGQPKYALGLPRGFAKTTLLKLFAAWLVLYTDRRFILVICNTAGLAENFISDVDDILRCDNIKGTFGDYSLGMEKDTLGLKKTHFGGRPVILAALGSYSSLRGLNIKFARPDVMIMDDMQSREEAESEVESDKGIRWMLGTLMKANNKLRCLFVFVGNMYPYTGSILKKLKHNPGWISFITGAILEDGESLWPELRSVEDILDELESDTSMGHPEIFYSEVMNDDEASNKSGIDISKIRNWLQLDIEPQAGFVMIDPSTGKKKRNAVAIGVVLIFDGIPVLWELSVGAYDPKMQITESFRLAMKYGLMAIIVEAVAYQATLAFWMEEAKTRYGLSGMQVLEIYPAAGTKNARILTALKQLTLDTPDIYVHPQVRSKLIHEIVQFNPLKTDNTDDILDIVAYTWPAIHQFGAVLLRPFDLPPPGTASFYEQLETSF